MVIACLLRHAKEETSLGRSDANLFSMTQFIVKDENRQRWKDRIFEVNEHNSAEITNLWKSFTFHSSQTFNFSNFTWGMFIVLIINHFTGHRQD